MNYTNLTSILPINNDSNDGEPRPFSGKVPPATMPARNAVNTSETAQTVQDVKSQFSRNDVELKFVHDQATNKMMIFVVDKTSKDVLRSIPPEEVEKLSVGDLLEIAA